MRARIAALVVSAAVAPLAAGAAERSIGLLAWLAGCWASQTAGPGSVEHWLPPAGGMMLGVSRVVRNGRTVEYEFVSIHEEADGRIVYTARPSGQAQASFTASSLDAASVTFENPEHDFPQRIIYRSRPDGGLDARIEGRRGGALRQVDFPMRRVSCDRELSASPQR